MSSPSGNMKFCLGICLLSSSIFISTSNAAAPSSVQDLNIGTVTTTTIPVSWAEPTGTSFTHFELRISPNDGGLSLPIEVNNGSNYFYTFNNLKPGRTYTVSIYVKAGTSTSSPVSKTVTTKPTPVATFTATGTGTTVDLTWEPNAQSVQDSYELSYKGQVQATAWTMAQKKLGTSATIENLFPGDMYTFQLEAVSNGQKSESKEYQHVTNPLPPPGLTVEEVTTSSIRVAWGYDSTKTHNTGYRIIDSPTAISNYQILDTTSVNGSSVTINGLPSGVHYIISVYSLTIRNTASLDASSVKATVKPVITSSLRDVRDETTNTTAVVAYTESNAYGVFDKYKISIIGSEMRSQLKDKDDQVRKVSFGTLVPGMWYRISAIVISGAQESTAVYTYLETKPNPPIIACKSYHEGLKVVLTKPFGVAHVYFVECVGPSCPQSPAQIPVNQGHPTESSHTFQNLTQYTAYVVKVTSGVVYAGRSKKSIVATRTCRTSESVPEAVEMFTFGDLKPYEVTLFWNEPTISNGLITEYLITYQGTKQNEPDTEKIEVSIEDANEKERTITDLKAGYTYIICIQAKTFDYGDQRNLTLTLPIESPWINQTLYDQSKPKQLKVTQNSLDMELFNPFTSKNGEITGYSVIVCSHPKQINQLDDVTADWETAIEDNPISPYAAIYKCPDLFLVGNACWDISRRRKRATEDRVVVRVGGNETCDLRPDYCNGPLKADRPYYILLRAYTENGLFSDSPLSDPAITDKKPSVLSSAAIGGMATGVSLTNILIVIIIYEVLR